MFCPKCGTPLPDDAEFCIKCGLKLSNVKIANENVEASIASELDNLHSQNTFSGQPEDMPEFKRYLDEKVRENTKFQSAQELLDSKPFASKLTWIILLIGIILGLLGFLFPIMYIVAFFVILIGEVGLIFFKMAIVENCPLKYYGKINSHIDTDDLKKYLNDHLSYMQPYFHEWSYEGENKNSLVKEVMLEGAVMGAINYIDAQAKKNANSQPDVIRLQTPFGKNNFPSIVLDIRPSDKKNEENTFKYTVNIGGLRGGTRTNNHSMGYKCVCKTALIVQAAMEYYLNNYK